MTIDIQPTVREASQFERMFMEVLGYDRIYYFMQGDKQYSVHWTDETIKPFLPNWTVSEYMENHLVNYATIFSRCMRAWEKQVHPYWTTLETEERYGKFYRTGREVPTPLSEPYAKRTAFHWLKSSYENFCKPLEFVIVTL